MTSLAAESLAHTKARLPEEEGHDDTCSLSLMSRPHYKYKMFLASSIST